MASSPLHLAAFDLKKLRLGVRNKPLVTPLSVGIPSIDEALPDAGLPRGSVVEVCAPNGLSKATRFALSTCATAQRAAKEMGELQHWCAWVDVSRTLFAPGVARAHVDLDRLLVVEPEPADIARVAVRLVTSGVFSVVVIDRCSVPGAELSLPRSIRWNTAVRRLALAAGEGETTVLLLSSEQQAKEALPVAMRIELQRPALERLSLRVAKDRRGRLGGPVSIPIVDVVAA